MGYATGLNSTCSSTLMYCSLLRLRRETTCTNSIRRSSMIVLPSYPMESIPNISIRGRNVPKISFFGRPGDPRKGVEVNHAFARIAWNVPKISFFGRPGDPRKGVIYFLDSLALMCRLADVPAFAVWIIGGSDGEAAFVESLKIGR